MEKLRHDIQRCSSLQDLERLHDRITRTIPARMRGEYIKLLNNREDEIMKLLYLKQEYPV
jgi:hypothetical protein